MADHQGVILVKATPGRNDRSIPQPANRTKRGLLLTTPDNDEFDPKAFLAKVGAGKTILEFRKNQHVFEQGDVADTVFYIQRGRVSYNGHIEVHSSLLSAVLHEKPLLKERD